MIYKRPHPQVTWGHRPNTDAIFSKLLDVKTCFNRQKSAILTMTSRVCGADTSADDSEHRIPMTCIRHGQWKVNNLKIRVDHYAILLSLVALKNLKPFYNRNSDWLIDVGNQIARSVSVACMSSRLIWSRTSINLFVIL